MTEGETFKAIQEQHRRLVELGQTAMGAEVARGEEIRRDALRLIGGPGSLFGLFNQKGTFADLMARTKSLGAFNDVAGVSRLISESAFASRSRRRRCSTPRPGSREARSRRSSSATCRSSSQG